ncbi:hypothetical protein Ancab_037700 [Ancistrocladus abbreviatus]
MPALIDPLSARTNRIFADVRTMQGAYFHLFTSLVLLPFFLSHVSTASRLAPAAEQTIVGGYQPIKNLNDSQIIEITKFAVEEYNKSHKTETLEFSKVVKGDFQVVEGINYKLLIEARWLSRAYNYLAFVFEDLNGHKKLESFIPAN